MIHAYDKIYLEKARTSMGRMLDFAVHDLNMDLEEFWKKFLSSELCSRFENGDSAVLAGMSGIEMAYSVLSDSMQHINPGFSAARSQEYWLGWALAYYQWDTGIRFRDIFCADDISKIRAMYYPYHEMDIRHFCNALNELYSEKNPLTMLKKYRLNAELTQAELSEESGVPVRTIQQYEQRQKNINKAQAEYVIRLAKALYCEPEDLLEKVRVTKDN